MHVRDAVREQGREIAAAGADLEHAVGLAQGKLLQHARLESGWPHPLAFADRDLHVAEGQRAMRRRYELLARHDVEQVEHVLVEYVPGPDLLLDHVEAGLFDVHGVAPGGISGMRAVVYIRSPAYLL